VTVLLGRTSAGATADFTTSDTTAAWSFVAAASGNLKYIFSQTQVANTATAVKLGIYADSAGAPGARLGFASVDDLTTANGTGVARATLSSTVAITSGTTYWLAWSSLGDTRNFQGDSAGSYKETDTARDFPDPFGTATTSSVNAIIWGEDAAALPDLMMAPRRV
jgi:hypothetical protein